MSFRVEYGDLFAAPPDMAVLHGVNCGGVMGAGVAREIRRRYPEASDTYQSACRMGRLHPGDALGVYDRAAGRYVVHCASQDRPGPRATEQWLVSSVSAGLQYAEKWGASGAALPLIGGGIGGIAPERAEELIGEVAGESPLDVVLVKLPQLSPSPVE